jgi:hypothetical protein
MRCRTYHVPGANQYGASRLRAMPRSRVRAAHNERPTARPGPVEEEARARARQRDEERGRQVAEKVHAHGQRIGAHEVGESQSRGVPQPGEQVLLDHKNDGDAAQGVDAGDASRAGCG